MHPYYVQQLFCELRAQSMRLEQIENHLKELRREVERLMNQNQTNIEHIDYHFELLKIEKLEGTLNIGLTPNEGKNLEEITVNGQMIGPLPAQYSHLYNDIQQPVIHYLQNEVPNQFYRAAKERNINLNKHQVQLAIQDLQKQTDHRIYAYLEQSTAISEEQRNNEEISRSIISQVIQDINAAVKQYIELHSAEKGDTNEDERHQ
ncbi:spore germination protein GerPC [Paenibacillus sp. DMB20]|uniref:spore germination protein GerPC n=1 Tax=Paenibacillus sp. DMB20 TaxID=1642570 RepID=UPI0006277571|nr:spore germination protein GerPC [Paenibacillus sp. DMB20]KKO51346.1 hypothetical protein XI25_26675 [Paenibacillus sp. DMB20]